MRSVDHQVTNHIYPTAQNAKTTEMGGSGNLANHNTIMKIIILPLLSRVWVA